MCTVLEYKEYFLLNVISSNNGLSIGKLKDILDDELRDKYVYSANSTIEDMVDTNMMIGRIGVENGKLIITPAGVKYINKMREVCV